MKSFDVPSFYRSELLGQLKSHRKKIDVRKKDFHPNILEFGKTSFVLPRFFGFCYGVENAIEIAYKAIEENPDKRIFLLSEMIHNPDVNKDLSSRGVKVIMDTLGNEVVSMNELHSEDIVLIPAFGTTLEIEEKLRKKNIAIEHYNTTCPFVEKVWNKSQSIGKADYTVIVHGKHYHEETRSTFSHTIQHTHSVIILNMEETKLLAQYIRKEKSAEDFYKDFKGKYSEGFDPTKHLEKIGIVNQTTILASETQSIAEFLKQTFQEHFNLNNETLKTRFADYRDTLCYATNDNQTAIIEALHSNADMALVIGGFNSSNTTQLYHLCKTKFKTYYINSASHIFEDGCIESYNLSTKSTEKISSLFESKDKLTILLSSGASCPDAIVEQIMKKIIVLREPNLDWEENVARILSENSSTNS